MFMNAYSATMGLKTRCTEILNKYVSKLWGNSLDNRFLDCAEVYNSVIREMGKDIPIERREIVLGNVLSKRKTGSRKAYDLFEGVILEKLELYHRSKDIRPLVSLGELRVISTEVEKGNLQPDNMPDPKPTDADY